MTWQPNENSPPHLDPRDARGAPPPGGGSSSDAAVQDAPIEDGALDADVESKIDGILEQTRNDLEQGHAHSALELLTQRFAESGIPLPPERVAALAASLSAVENG